MYTIRYVKWWYNLYKLKNWKFTGTRLNELSVRTAKTDPSLLLSIFLRENNVKIIIIVNNFTGTIEHETGDTIQTMISIVDLCLAIERYSHRVETYVYARLDIYI